ncbi:MAG: LacI family DNA-binding transcriptional regulator [Saprospiraceae bacterium]
MAKKSTIEDIARELNVTASTVSRALNGNSRISEGMRKAVLAAAKKLNYQHNQIASALRSGRSYIVGVLVPTADRSFFAQVVRGIEEEVNKAGYSVIICQSNDQYESEKRNLEALLRLRADGIIASIAKETQDYQHFAQLKEKGVALVLYDRVYEKLDVNTVIIDDYRGAYQAVEHLIDQGAKRIAHFAGLQHINIYRERLCGYMDALKAYALPIDESLIIYSNNLFLEDGANAMRKLLQLNDPPDAIFSASDYAALGAMQVLKQVGKKVPEEIALVGFANEPFTAFVEPGLTTIDQHSQQMGAAAARLFLEQIARKTNEYTPRRVVLHPTLCIRGSSLKS